MLHLPVELRRLCLEALENHVEDLKSVRLINKELGVLATEILFRKAILNTTEESTEKFEKILRSHLNPLVHNLVINTSDDPEYSGGGQKLAEFPEEFLEMIRLLHEFPKLEEVELKFAQEVAVDDDSGWEKEVAETPQFRKEVFEDFWPALRKADSVRILTIKNLQDYHDEDIFQSEDFIVVRNRLARLHLQIATEYDDASPENSIKKPALHTGFGRDLPNIWLTPLSGQLTHLTLYGTECFWGVYPFVDFRNVPTFARLKSLCMGNFIVAHDWQIDWILSHSETLETLIMDDCSIVAALRMDSGPAKANFPDLAPKILSYGRFGITIYYIEVPLRWHMVMDRFRTGLPVLRHFAMGHGDWDEGRAFEERYELLSETADGRYCFYDWGIGPSQWIVSSQRVRPNGYSFGSGAGEDKYVKFPTCHEEDQKALMDLLECVERQKDADR